MACILAVAFIMLMAMGIIAMRIANVATTILAHHGNPVAWCMNSKPLLVIFIRGENEDPVSGATAESKCKAVAFVTSGSVIKFSNDAIESRKDSLVGAPPIAGVVVAARLLSMAGAVGAGAGVASVIGVLPVLNPRAIIKEPVPELFVHVGRCSL
jgi:hypothetical protein